MKCPFCGEDNTRVVDSRPVEDTNSIRRRRMCESCGKRFTTYEKVETIPLSVIKKDQNREPYSRSKIQDGILRACYKRPIPVEKIEEIMDENVIYAKTLDDQEEVAETIRKYGLIAIPIIDHEMCMVGIVTVDDAMFVLQDEATEDISIMAGVSPSEGSYFGTSVFRHAKNRSLWLMLLMLSATVTGEILGRYESAMAVMPVLITFIPMLMGTGGNCGSQSSTLVIRGIAVGEIEFKDIFRVILILAMVNGLRIYIMYDQDVMLAVAIGITMIAVVVMAKTIGCVLPLAAKKIGLDPAIMAAPLITTILDTCTILVYFRIVTAFFHI